MITINTLRWTTFCCLTVFCVTLYADNEDIRHALIRMSEARHAHNYHGQFVHMIDGKLEPLIIAHSSTQDAEVERLASLSGPLRELIRDNESYACYVPGDHEGLAGVSEFTNPLPIFNTELIELILKNYSATIETSADRVANRDTSILTLSPKDTHRFYHRFWLDQETGFLLRYDLINQSKALVEQIMFLHIEFVDTLDPKLVKAQSTVKPMVWKHPKWEQADKSTESHWAVDWLPSGFILKKQDQRLSPVSQVPVEHWLFTDGLSKLSLFFEPDTASQGDPASMMHMGSTLVYAKKHGVYILTVVGEIPEPTAKKIVNSVRLDSSS